jgi:hypothetical protein
MLTVAIVLALVSAGAAAAGYVMWWASHQSTLVNICIAMLLAVLAFAIAIFIGYVLMRFYAAPLNPL